MATYTPLWIGLAFAGFLLGLFLRPMVVLRMAIGLGLLAGLGLMLANTWGSQHYAFVFGALGVALLVVFGVSLLGSFAGWIIRRIVHEPPKPRRREYNSILQE
jgi:hypothetical protein